MEDAGPASASSPSLAKPAGSRVSAMTMARYLWVLVSIHASPGRITSAQMSISSPDDRSLSSEEALSPLSCSHRSGSWTQELPGCSSARDASHRCCQVSPGNEDSQRSSLAVPRRRPAWVAFISARNGGKASRRSTSSSPWAVAGHRSWPGLGGNCLRSWLLRGCAAAAVPAAA
jgi:hypothetical protein